MEENKIISKCKAIIIGGSAGSLTVLLDILPFIKSGFDAVIIVVLHRKNTGDDLLANLFSYKTEIPVKEVEDKDPIINGTIYIAPADYHLLIERDLFFSLDASEKINYSRPSIDVAFESAAMVYKNCLAGLLLSGANSDGVNGLKIIQNNGGMALVQDPQFAESPFMPQSAIHKGYFDKIIKTEEIADYINKLIF